MADLHSNDCRDDGVIQDTYFGESVNVKRAANFPGELQFPIVNFSVRTWKE